jgi:hypothetical protein
LRNEVPGRPAHPPHPRAGYRNEWRGPYDSRPGQDRLSRGTASDQFEGRSLYPTLAEKAAALAFSLNMNHPFQDGNKRTSHAAMEMFPRMANLTGEVKKSPSFFKKRSLFLRFGAKKSVGMF